ncbi:hypothetical protein CAEBREN_02836 [Caenorhabditis brenneri]|uniref:G-protein coupled receptors family 1 profile domain-containing protein n=1 Tax=Caenorhabditis brenneri TaxID=135651 RepID=G0P471_CAEBE|nr:hypothetical protein CAEBREN_02836 [Caenorhabditis brenneri]
MTDYEYQYVYEHQDGSKFYHYNYVMEPDAMDKVESYSQDTLTIVINLFHLTILLQKEVRTVSIYTLMIGICISDLLNFTLSVYMEGVDRSWYPRIYSLSERDCLQEKYIVFNFGYEIIRMLINSTRTISVFLALSMALIRTITLAFPLHRALGKLNSVKSSFLQINLVTLFWISYYSWIFLLILLQGFPRNLCDLKGTSRTVTVYVSAIPTSLNNLINKREDWEHLVRIVPTVLYPILSIKLLMKLNEISEQRRRVSDPNNERKEQSDSLTKLILFMTISFMLSEGMDGIRSFFLVDLFYWGPEFPGIRRLILSTPYLITSLRCLNSISHPFVCYFMSSQYKNAVLKMTGKPNVVIVKSFKWPSSRNSVGKVTTLNY